jgi:hypothetical protein
MMEEIEAILDQGFTDLAGYHLETDKIETLAERLAEDILIGYYSEIQEIIKAGLIDRFNAALDVERDTFHWVHSDKIGWPPSD